MISIRDYLTNAKPSPYAHCHNFYDWFCRDSSLVKKEAALKSKVASLVLSRKIDIDKHYVWFKNNCPMNGPLYDDFRIADMETQDTLWAVIPKCGHSGKAEVWGAENHFAGPIVSGTWDDVYNFFMVAK